jgi:hypothetical protein
MYRPLQRCSLVPRSALVVRLIFVPAGAFFAAVGSGLPA